MDNSGGELPRELIPPRSLEVSGFAAARSSEIEALYNALKSQTDTGSTRSFSLTTARHLRRRTSSHNRRPRFRWRHKASVGSGKESDSSTQAFSFAERSNAMTALDSGSSRKRKADGTPSRRVRRKMEFQEVKVGSGTPLGDGTRRLTTHVWHAKRFPMTKQWGYILPKGLPGRGKGSRSVFKWVNEEAVLHDASYIGVIELLGPKGSILQVLRETFEQQSDPDSEFANKEFEAHGLCYGRAMLRSFPNSHGHMIAPVTFLWRPTCTRNKPPPGLSKVDEVEERQLWVWVHPDAFDCALQTLSIACRESGSDTSQPSIKCYSRHGELGRLDLFGSKALQILQKVLRPSPRTGLDPRSGLTNFLHQDMDTNASNGPSTDSQDHASLLAKADCLPAAAVLALVVKDPRDKPIASSQTINSSLETGDSDRKLVSGGWSSVEKETFSKDGLSAIEMKKDPAEHYWENIIEEGLVRDVSDSPYLWSPKGDDKVEALSQKALSAKRQKIRNALFGLVQNNWERADLDGIEGQSKGCPILLLKHAHMRSSASGWSIILPSNWVHAFWVPLVMAGGRVIGLRERHWLSTDAGIPYFPNDYPDCAAHARYLTAEVATFNAVNERRPSSKKAPSFSLSPLQRLAMNFHGYCALGCVRGSHAGNSMTKIDSTAETLPPLNFESRDGSGTPQCPDSVVEAALDGEPQPIGEPLRSSLDTDGRAFIDDTDAMMLDNGTANASLDTDGGAFIDDTDATNLDRGTANATFATHHVNAGSDCADQVSLMPIGSGSGTEQGEVQLEDITVSGAEQNKVQLKDITISGKEQNEVRLEDITVGGTDQGEVQLEDITISGTEQNEMRLEDMTVSGTEQNEVQLEDITVSATKQNEVQLEDITVSGTEQNEVQLEDITVSGTGQIEMQLDVTISRTEQNKVQLEDVIVSGTGQIEMQLEDVTISRTEQNKVQVEDILSPSVTSPTVCGAGHQNTKDLGPDVKVTEATDIGTRSLLNEGVIEVNEKLTSLPPEGGIKEQSPAQVGCLPAAESLMVFPSTSHSQATFSNVYEMDQDAVERSMPSGLNDLGLNTTTEIQILKPKQVEHESLRTPGDRSTSVEVRVCDGAFGLEDYSAEQTNEFSPTDARETPSVTTHCTHTHQQRLTFFVARTAGTLVRALNGGDEQHHFKQLRCDNKCENGSRLQKARLDGYSTHVISESPNSITEIYTTIGGIKKMCYVRVLIAIPRKGVVKENGVLCLPTDRDVSAYLDRNQRWQGVEFSLPRRQSKGNGKMKRKRKKGETQLSGCADILKSAPTPTDDERYEECCTRNIIGCITSTGPRGSLWSGTGICEIGSLMKMRALQWTNERWRDTGETLLLAGNQRSPVLRPVLVSIAVESRYKLDV